MRACRQSQRSPWASCRPLPPRSGCRRRGTTGTSTTLSRAPKCTAVTRAIDMGKVLYRLMSPLFGVQELDATGAISLPRFRTRAFKADRNGLNEHEQYEHYWYQAVMIHVPVPTYGTALRHFKVTRKFGWAILYWWTDSRTTPRWHFGFERAPL